MFNGGSAEARCPAQTAYEPAFLSRTVGALVVSFAVLLLLDVYARKYDRQQMPAYVERAVSATYKLYEVEVEWVKSGAHQLYEWARDWLGLGPLPESPSLPKHSHPTRRVSTTNSQPSEPSGGMSHELFPHAKDFLHLKLEDVSFGIRDASVLKGLHGEVHEGELCALMGESGSGKTTLLNVLGGRASYGQVSGAITLNGRPFNPLRVNLGFVPQAYLIMKELTVAENLVYSAALRLDRTVCPRQRMQIVDSAIELLGLNRCRDFVCDKNLTKARLSGGQLRRVGIGVELVTLPRLLLLDEPTSALDAVNTRLVVQALKLLAQRGILVMASLHQPRFSVYQMLDKLFVLRQGEFVLSGPREDALPFFKSQGFVPAPGENPADFFIEVAFGFLQSTNEARVGEEELPAKLKELMAAEASAAAKTRAAIAKEQGNVTFDEFTAVFDERYGAVMDPSLKRSVWDRARALHTLDDDQNNSASLGQNSRQGRRRSKAWDWAKANMWSLDQRRLERAAVDRNLKSTVPYELLMNVIDNWQVTPTNVPPAWHQFKVCTQRYLLKIMRTRKELQSRYVLFCLLGCLCGAIQGVEPKNQIIIVFLILTIAAFSCVIGTTTLKSLGDGPIERDFFAHEASLGVYQACECIARMLVDLLPGFLLPLVFSQPLLGLTASHAHSGEAFCLFGLISWSYTGLGYLVALLAPANAAVLYVAIAFILSSFMAGAFGITVHDAVDAPGLGPGWVACQVDDCGNATALAEQGTDGYHDADGYGFFAYLPGFWGMLSLHLLWMTALPTGDKRRWLLYEASNFGYVPRRHAQDYDEREVQWLYASLWSLFLFGLTIRIVTLIIFVARNHTVADVRSAAAERVTQVKNSLSGGPAVTLLAVQKHAKELVQEYSEYITGEDDSASTSKKQKSVVISSWRIEHDDDGKSYWYNPRTGESAWQKPEDHIDEFSSSFVELNPAAVHEIKPAAEGQKPKAIELSLSAAKLVEQLEAEDRATDAKREGGKHTPDDLDEVEQALRTSHS